MIQLRSTKPIDFNSHSVIDNTGFLIIIHSYHVMYMKVMCKTWIILLPYRWKFSLDKNFVKPRCLCIAEIFGGINFANAVKVAISSMQSLTQDKKFVDKKFHQQEQVAKLAKIFSWRKFPPVRYYTLYMCIDINFVGHCLATKAFIGKLPVTRGMWVIILTMKGNHGLTK